VNDGSDTRAVPAPALELSPAARAEWQALGLDGTAPGPVPVPLRAGLPRRRLSAPRVLNEAFDYAHPASFSRGVGLDLPGVSLLFLSGTASVDEHGATLYPGDFNAQCLRTLRNLACLLSGAGASWHDVVRTTCYLRDIERDYDAFNEIRTAFMTSIGLDPLPASTGIQARLCRSDLLIEIEALAVVPRD
jgi:enamine deaminase RidA (YjgF/YER057c/UK114 family)